MGEKRTGSVLPAGDLNELLDIGNFARHGGGLMLIGVAMERNHSQDGVVWIGLGFLLHEALLIT